MSDKISKIEERISKQEEQLKLLKEQKRKAENQMRAKERAKERKDDTRRKILVGSVMLKLAETSEENKQKLMSSLDRYLTNDRDRELFDLPK